MQKLKVLLITRECLRAASNEGNVLLNLFEGLPVELANIYCKPGIPNSAQCRHYFQLTDRMALENVLRHVPMGCEVQLQEQCPEETAKVEAENKKFYDFFRNHNLEIFHLVRECLWQLADFKSDRLEGFIKSFSPDVIFAPLCYNRFVLRIHRYAIGFADCPAVTYIYDDLYSLRQLRFSPVYWLNRFLLRRAIRKNLPLYRFAYTMTEQQASEYKQMLKIPMKILLKCVAEEHGTPITHEGIRVLYAGGIYYGRDKTLVCVADAVRCLQTEGYDVRLDIYTSSPLKKRVATKLNDGQASKVHSPVMPSELMQLYAQSDIALHVESFKKRNALLTRLSFSTKIVDCLASGCAVLAICPKINAGWQYLEDEQAALCICKTAQIKGAVRQLAESKNRREQLAAAAKKCLAQYHDSEKVRGALLKGLSDIVEQSRNNDRKIP